MRDGGNYVAAAVFLQTIQVMDSKVCVSNYRLAAEALPVEASVSSKCLVVGTLFQVIMGRKRRCCRRHETGLRERFEDVKHVGPDVDLLQGKIRRI